MKGRKRIYLQLVAIMTGIYLGLLMILYFSESASSSATIRTFGDAFWYSLVTLTTVGYGDMMPVTPLGHAVGVVFLILATGIMVTLLGAVVSFLTSEAVPLILLRFQSHKDWYYFADCGAESVTLAGNIYKEDPGAVIIFGEKRSEQNEVPDYPCMFLGASLAKTVAQKRNHGSRCKVFLMRENDIGVNTRANNLHELPVEVYARTTNGQDKLSGNIIFFHSYDCCARNYWHSRPLCSHENTIVIIGFGNYGQCILERAILMNIVRVDQHVTYHVFGDAKEFLAMHYRLGEVFSVNEESERGDSLIFHDEFWGEQPELLERADRIIICDDNEMDGWNIFWKMSNYYKIQGRIDLRNSRKAPGVSYFGTNEEIYTPDEIMRTRLNKAAVTINEIFRRSVSYETLSWEELDDFHRQSKIAAADHLCMKLRILLEDETITEYTADVLKEAYRKYCRTRLDEDVKDMYRRLDHMRWLRFYVFYNWSCGRKRDDTARQHPMLCAYEKLTPEQKKERDAAWEILGNLSEEFVSG